MWYSNRNLFALHYIPFGDARSTVQTEQAMPERAWGRAAWLAATENASVHICGTVRMFCGYAIFIPIYIGIRGITDLNGVP